MDSQLCQEPHEGRIVTPPSLASARTQLELDAETLRCQSQISISGVEPNLSYIGGKGRNHSG